MTHTITLCILTFALCTLTYSEVIESDTPTIDGKNEAPYSSVGKENTGDDVITSKDTTDETPSLSTTPEPVKSYGCNEYGYCQGTLFPYEVTVEGRGWKKTLFCQQGINPTEHCCLPVTKHFICYNITVKYEGRLSLGDGSQKEETDFTALCREMLKTENQTLARYSFVSKAQGGAGVVYRHGTWWKVDSANSSFIQDLACDYDVEDDDDDDDEVTSDIAVTTETPEEEEEEEEEEDEDEDEEEREKKEREMEEGGSDGGGGGGGERPKKPEEEEDEEEEQEEEEKEEEQKKKKKKGRRH